MKKIAVVLSIITLFFTGVNAGTVTLKVYVKDSNSTAIPGTTLMLSTWSKDPNTNYHVYDAARSCIGTTNASGYWTTSFESEYMTQEYRWRDYRLVASKQGYSPTAARQECPDQGTWYEWGGVWADDTVTTVTRNVVLNPDSKYGASDKITVELTYDQKPRIFHAWVQNASTMQGEWKPIAMKIFEVSAGDVYPSTFTIDNVPWAEPGTYMINVGCPSDNKNSPNELVGNMSSAVTIDLTNNGRQESTTVNTEQTGNVVFDGFIKEYGTNTPVANARVMIRKYQSPDPPFQTISDDYGYFVFYESVLDNEKFYVIEIQANGYAGFQTSEYYYSSTTDPSHYLDNIMLTAVDGQIEGTVLLDGTPLPYVWVNAWGDWTSWVGGDPCNFSAWGSGQVQSDNGTFSITGLASGNYRLEVNSDFTQQPYCFNNGPDMTENTEQHPTDTWRMIHTGDDYRITVDTTSGTTTIYDAAGGVVNSPIQINIPASKDTSGSISGTVTYFENTLGQAITLENNFLIIAREEWQSYEERRGDSMEYVPMKAGFVSVNGTGTEFPYEIKVSSGYLYRIEVKSKNYGVLKDQGGDILIDLRDKAVSTGLNFKIGTGGTIKGVVKLPDGSLFKPVQGDPSTGLGGEVYAEGKTIRCYTGSQIKDDGSYEITGLLPGSYEMRVHGWGNFQYAKPNMDWVAVVAEGTTFLEITLQPGVRCYPSITGDLTYSSGKMQEGWTRKVIGMPAGIKFDKNKMINTVFDDPEISFYENSPDLFDLQYLPYGTYDFYVSPEQDWDKLEESGEFMMYALFAGESKGVEVNPTVPMGVLPDNHWSAGSPALIIALDSTVGEAALEGTMSGKNIFNLTQAQLDAMAQNFDEFVNYIPSVVLYDTGGKMRAWAIEVPPTKGGGAAWEAAVATGDLGAIQTALQQHPPRYRIEGLSEGVYTFVAFSPTYRTPVIRQITIPATGTTSINVDFDSEVGDGASFVGIVTDRTTGDPAANASVILKSRIMDDEIITTDDQGQYEFKGLQKGTYEIVVSKSGSALTGARKAIEKNASVQVNFNLESAPGSFSGTVYLRMMPSPQVFPGAKVYAYDETFNGTYPNEYLPKYSATTDRNGQYTITGVITGHLYKLYMVSDGKQLEYIERTGTDAVVTGCDFVMRSAPPESNIKSRISEDGTAIEFFMQSPKKLIDTPAYMYQEGTVFDAEKPYTDTSKTAVSKPNNLYKITIGSLNPRTDYVLRITADDGANEPSVIDTVFNLSMKAKSKKELKEEVAAGGDVYMTEGTDDFTSLGIQTGGLTPTGTSTNASPGLNPRRISPQAAVGGFISTLPGVQISKDNRNSSTVLMNLISSVLASDLYTIDLSSAQINRDLTVSLNYDKTRVTDLDALKVYQYDAVTGQWNVLPGTPTIDPVTGTISVDVDSLGNASGAQSAPRMAGKARFNGTKYVINANAATSQTGVFAVLTAPPVDAKAYTGGVFKAYNFPNPFDLTSKTLPLTDDMTAGATLTTRGTIIKYYMPASVSGKTVIYLYNIAGEMVRRIDEGDKDGGYIYYTEWDGKNDNGSSIASGVYFCMIQVDGKKQKLFKMAVIK